MVSHINKTICDQGINHLGQIEHQWPGIKQAAIMLPISIIFMNPKARNRHAVFSLLFQSSKKAPFFCHYLYRQFQLPLEQQPGAYHQLEEY